MLSIAILGALTAAALRIAAGLRRSPAPAAMHEEGGARPALAEPGLDGDGSTAVDPAAPASFGALEGTIGGRPLVARAALLSASGNGEAVLAIADVPYTCADQEAQRVARPDRAIYIFLEDIAGPLPLNKIAHPPAHAGSYSVIHFLDFRAAWFQAPGATPRRGEGTRPPDGSYAAILSNAGGKAAGPGVNWPIGVAGTVTLDHFPQSTAERATGLLAARFESGETLQGSFSAQACSELFTALAPAAQAGP